MQGFLRPARVPWAMQGNLPPEVQEKVEELQDLQETAQQVMAQKQEAETELNEAEAALDALEDTEGDSTVYQQVGQVLVESDQSAAIEDLEETQSSLEVRVETLGKQEERVQDQFESLQQELQGMIGGGMGGGGPGGPGGPSAGGA